jgi:hypothetical protein
MWKITDEPEVEVEPTPVVEPPAPTGPRYKVIKEVTHNEVRYPPDTVLPVDLIRPDGIEWLLTKKAIEKIEE